MRFILSLTVLLVSVLFVTTSPANANDGNALFNQFRCMLTASWDNEKQAKKDVANNIKPFDQHEWRSMTYVPILNDEIEGQLFGILNYNKTGFKGSATRLSTHRFRWSAQDNAIVHEFFFLKEKGDWGENVQNDLKRLTRITEDDVTINSTCAMRWQWQGDHFSGSTETGKCITSSFTEAPILIEGHGELFSGQLRRHDQNFDLEGNALPVKGGKSAELFDRVNRQHYPAGMKETIIQVSTPLSCKTE